MGKPLRTAARRKHVRQGRDLLTPETAPKLPVTRNLPTGGCANAGVAVACRSPVRWSERSLRCATGW